MSRATSPDISGLSDRTFLRLVTTAALAAVSIPFALLAVFHPAGSTYTGVLVASLDNYVYLSQMLHAHDGQWLFRDSFTHVNFAPILLLPFYSVLGKLTPSGPIPWGPGIVLHLLRLGFLILFVQQAWRLFGEVLPGRGTRRVAMLFLLFTAGFGVFWLLVPESIRGSVLSFDLVSPQSSSFYTLLEAPHYAAELVLLVVLLRAFNAGMRRDRLPRGWLAVGGGLSLALSFIHPDKILVLTITVGLYLTWAALALRVPASQIAKRALWSAALILPGLPYVAYITWHTLYDPLLQVPAQQTPTPSIVGNPILYLLIGYGFPGLCALVAVARIVRRPRTASPGLVLLTAFAAGGLVLLPVNHVWNPAHGSQVAISGLAAAALTRRLLPRFWRTRAFRRLVGWRPFGYDRVRLRQMSLNLVLIASAPTIMAVTGLTPFAAFAAPDSFYVSSEDRSALAWMHANVPHDDVVVAAPVTAQFVVAYGGARVAFGDQFLTPNYDREGSELTKFFRGGIDRPEYFRQHSADWLYFGPREVRVASFDPANSAFLQPVFSTGSTVIYRVTLPARSVKMP